MVFDSHSALCFDSVTRSDPEGPHLGGRGTWQLQDRSVSRAAAAAAGACQQRQGTESSQPAGVRHSRGCYQKARLQGRRQPPHPPPHNSRGAGGKSTQLLQGFCQLLVYMCAACRCCTKMTSWRLCTNHGEFSKLQTTFIETGTCTAAGSVRAAA